MDEEDEGKGRRDSVWCCFYFEQKTAYDIMPSLVGSEMCIRDRRALSLQKIASICCKSKLMESAYMLKNNLV